MRCRGRGSCALGSVACRRAAAGSTCCWRRLVHGLLMLCKLYSNPPRAPTAMESGSVRRVETRTWGAGVLKAAGTPLLLRRRGGESAVSRTGAEGRRSGPGALDVASLCGPQPLVEFSRLGISKQAALLTALCYAHPRQRLRAGTVTVPLVPPVCTSQQSACTRRACYCAPARNHNTLRCALDCLREALTPPPALAQTGRDPPFHSGDTSMRHTPPATRWRAADPEPGLDACLDPRTLGNYPFQTGSASALFPPTPCTAAPCAQFRSS
jgi:hypothetical protein